MNLSITGLHHVTAIAGDPQRNLDFYVGLLGLRFVKRTVNFDDPTAYHLYFGDAQGRPGTLVTFFEWRDRPRGYPGIGATHHFALAAETPAVLLQWKRWLADRGCRVTGPYDR